MPRIPIAALVAGAMLSAGATLLTSPAFAVCAEGTPHCLKLDAGHIAAGKQVQQSLKGGGGFECKGGGLCGHDSGGNPSPNNPT